MFLISKCQSKSQCSQLSALPLYCYSRSSYFGIVRLAKPLVYRNRHNSTDIVLPSSSCSRLRNYQDFYSVSPNKIVRYTRNMAPDTRDYRSELLSKGWTIGENDTLVKPDKPVKITKSQEHYGLMSGKANNSINKRIDWLLHLCTNKKSWNKALNKWFYWKANFITLTLSSKQIHSDHKIKTKLLNHFFLTAKREWKMKNYIWRAESQTNGNIHFHIITDVWIPWQELQTEWNSIQDKLGYVSKYQKTNGIQSPNSTDIHSLKNINNIAKYLSKYCSKNSKGITVSTKLANSEYLIFSPKKKNWKYPKKNANFYRAVNGRLWGSNQELSKLDKVRIKATDDLKFALVKAQNIKPNMRIDFDFVSIFKFQIKDYLYIGLNSLYDKVNELVSKIIKPPNQLELTI